MTSEELLAIIERANAATKGYWLLNNHDAILQMNTEEAPDTVVRLSADRPADADFLAHARTDIDALIFEVGRLQGANAMLRGFAESLASYAIEKRYADCCVWCDEQGQSYADHLPGCPVAKAIQFLGLR